MKVTKGGTKMRVSQDGKTFREVVIVLETQDEVDQLFSVSNRDSTCGCGYVPVMDSLFDELFSIRSKPNSDKWFDTLATSLETWAKRKYAR